ncbi:hypothetical protein RI367_003301 [Sorochytrium milnesiophthora]
MQLPKNVRPSHYNVTLSPDLQNFTYTGVVEIALAVLQPTNTIVLNSLGLNIKNATIVIGQEKHYSTSPTYNTKEQTVTFKSPVYLNKGQTPVLRMVFDGMLNDQEVGFYRSEYQIDGAKHYMAVTQFEPVGCRRAIPSFDEPALKATFDVTLVVAKHLTALSNSDVVSRHAAPHDANKEVVKFARTPLMSSYLLAFAVGEFEFIEAKTQTTVYQPKPVRVRVYTTKGLSHQGHFALNLSVHTLEYYSKLFGIPYPLPKCDSLSVPTKTESMENWGLITYGPDTLLIEDLNAAMQTKISAARTITHELAHQWFGNLVTMESWSDLWLNEGFAEWTAFLGMEHQFPEWKPSMLFLSDLQGIALVADGMRSSHPIQVEVPDPKKVREIFDATTYYKAASVIHMLSKWLGDETFFKGIHNYLVKHRYKNVNTNDLWDSLSEVSGQNVSNFATTWTAVIGYPVLKVDEHFGPSGKKLLRLSQMRYLSSGDVSPEENKTVWPVPLNIAAAVKKQTGKEEFAIVNKDILKERTKTIELDIEDPKAPFLVNFNRSAFYRVAYSEEALQRLAAAIKRGALGVRDRLSLYDDAYALARAGFQSTSGFLALTSEGLTSESDPDVLTAVIEYMTQIRNIWMGRSKSLDTKWNKLLQQMFAPHANRIGFDDRQSDTAETKTLRARLSGVVGESGDGKTVKECRERYSRFINGDRSAIAADLYLTVFSVVVANGGEEEFTQVTTLFENKQGEEQRIAAGYALGYTRKPELIVRLLKYSLGSQYVEPADLKSIWASLSLNRYARHSLWQFFTSHWEALVKHFTQNTDGLCDCVESAVLSRTSEEDSRAMTNFFEKKSLQDCGTQINQTASIVAADVNWLKRDGKAVDEWLSKHVSAGN